MAILRVGLEFLFKHTERLEEGKRLTSRLFIKPGDGKSDMNNGVIANLQFGQVCETDLFDDPVEINLAHAGEAVVVDFNNATGYAKTHTIFPFR
jgi:hypothetical protein